MIVLGASAGGVRALLDLFGGLPSELRAAIAVVLHRSPVHLSVLDAVLGRRTRLPVIEPSDGEAFEAGRISLAPRDQHLLVDGRRLRLTRGPKEHDTRPAIDPLFVSAAAAFGPRVVGMLLSGTGADGARGLIAIKAAGGLLLAQSPDEAQYPAMPRNAVAHDRVSAALPAWELAARAARAGARRAFTPQESSRGRQATPA